MCTRLTMASCSHRFYVCESESWQNFHPFMSKFAERLSRLPAVILDDSQYPVKVIENMHMSALEDVEFVHDDHCCRGGDHTQHPSMTMFPKVHLITP